MDPMVKAAKAPAAAFLSSMAGLLVALCVSKKGPGRGGAAGGKNRVGRVQSRDSVC